VKGGKDVKIAQGPVVKSQEYIATDVDNRWNYTLRMIEDADSWA